MMNDSTRIGFIGLGNMGGPMACNLHRAGYAVRVFDLSAAAMQKVSAEGVATADSVELATQGAQIVISMLPASQHVERLYIEQGLLSQLAPGTLVVDCSTISPEASRRVAAAAQQFGVLFVDAPVSGGTAGAAAATLTFMLGGDASVVQQVEPILRAMGKAVFHAGEEVGAGQVAKICNNMLLAILMVGTSEALALGQASGLKPEVLSEIMRQSSGGNWVLERYNPIPGVAENVPASRSYTGGFAVDLMLKDLGLAQAAAQNVSASIPLGSLARNLYAMHRVAGNGQLDFSSIVQLLQASIQQ